MNRQEKAKLIQKVLETTFPHPEIPLFHTNPYTFLLAVLLSAHTTDKSVNGVTKLLFSLADCPEEMTALSEQEIYSIIRPCGLGPTKAKAILNLSFDLLANHQGQVPKTIKELEKLPGVGHKTASVVVSQIFNIPAFPVDTHIHRLAKRWGLSKGKNVQQTEKDLKKLFPKTEWKKLHLQMIYFGRNFCKATGHKKDLCPICKDL